MSFYFTVIYSLDKDENGNEYAIVSSIDTNLALEATVWTSELKPPPQINWNVGDNCRAEWSEDHAIYESVILAFGDHEGKKYANVEFYGYLNQDNIWMENLMPSFGDEAIQQQKAEAGYIEEKPKDEVDSIKKKEWKVGDDCRAIFQDDGLEYEGLIEDIAASDDGAQYATVKVNWKLSRGPPLPFFPIYRISPKKGQSVNFIFQFLKGGGR